MKMLCSLFLLSSLATTCHSLDATPTQFVLSSTGPATKFKGHALGLYTKNTDTGYYEQEGGDYYLLEERRGWWFAFPHISGCDRKKQWSCIARWAGSLKTKNLTGNTWLFGKGEDWQEDPTIQFAPLDPASCLHCPSVILASKGPAGKAKPEYFGTFPWTGSYSAGRPVYANKDGKFLMMKNEYTTYAVWDDNERRVSAGKPKAGSNSFGDALRGVRSSEGPTCVTELGSVARWQYQDSEGVWSKDDNISVECLE